MSSTRLLFVLLICIFYSCKSKPKSKYKTIGSIVRLDPSLDSVISPNAKPEIIAEGFEWSEGPVWVESEKMLLFSDVPRDTIYKWTEEKGKEVYLTPSGYTDTIPRGGEMGSNGLLIDKNGSLVLCQHGNRQLARMNAPLNNPKPDYVSIASFYEGKKFNSPNDAVYHSSGELYFTDPPYGLEKQEEEKEIPYQGLYRVTTLGQVILIDTFTRPNGIAFMPGEKTLILANSDPQKPYWYSIDISREDSMGKPSLFYSMEGYDKTLKGLPDGLKITRNGIVFATAPGGLVILNKSGKLIGKINLPDATSNCAFSPDEKTLYITNAMYVLRLKMRD